MANRSLAGSRARLEGLAFEARFVAIAKMNECAVTRIPDGCRSAGKRLIRVKSPFDYIVSSGKKVLLADTKTTEKDSFQHSDITPHQVAELASHEDNGIHAGYVILFRKLRQVVFISAYTLADRLRKGRGSILPNSPECIQLGTPEDFDVRRIFES